MPATLEHEPTTETTPTIPAVVAVELLMTEATRRIAACRAVNGLLGGRVLDACWDTWNLVDAYADRLARGYLNEGDRSHSDTIPEALTNARELLAAVARLEDSLFSLASAAIKRATK